MHQKIAWIAFSCIGLLSGCSWVDSLLDQDAPQPPTPNVEALVSSTPSGFGHPSSAANQYGLDAMGAENREEQVGLFAGDLLGAIPAQVVVSSTRNPRQHGPDKLIDGDLRSVWSSAVGDQIGAWIAIQLPQTVKVRAIKLTVGISGSDLSEAAFLKTDRIRALRIFVNGNDLGEYELNPRTQDLQEINLDGARGVLKLVVTQIEKGRQRGQGSVDVAELQVWGTAGAEAPRCVAEKGCNGAVARVGALRSGASEPRVSTKGLARRPQRRWEGPGKAPFPPEDRPYQYLVQGEWRSAVYPIRLVELIGTENERVFTMLYLVEEEAAEGHRPRRRGRCRRPDEAPCPNLYVARLSLRSQELPVLDRELIVARNVCRVESSIDLRDIDGDNRDEVLIRADLHNHETCGGGTGHRITELIADIESFHEQWRGVLLHDEGERCADVRSAIRENEDINGDGLRDLLLRVTVDEMRCERGGRGRSRRFEEERFFYDRGRDEWRQIESATEETLVGRSRFAAARCRLPGSCRPGMI